MDKKEEIEEIVRELNKETYNRWNCRRGRIINWFDHIYLDNFDNNIYVCTNLIGKWKELTNKYSKYQLENYMKDYIRKFIKNKYNKELDNYCMLRWNGVNHQLYGSLDHDIGIIWVHPKLIGKWLELNSTKYTNLQLEHYMIDFINKFVKEKFNIDRVNINGEISFEIKFDYTIGK